MHRRALISALGLLVAAGPELATASEGKTEKKKGGGESFLPIAPIAASTSGAGGRRGVLIVEVGVDVPDSRLRAACDLSLPRLRAAYVGVVLTYAAGLTAGAVPDPDYLSIALQRETDRVLGKKGARLLLGSIMVN